MSCDSPGAIVKGPEVRSSRWSTGTALRQPKPVTGSPGNMKVVGSPVVGSITWLPSR